MSVARAGRGRAASLVIPAAWAPGLGLAGLALLLLAGGYGTRALAPDAKAGLAGRLIDSAWARAVDGEPTPKPWPWADTWPVARLTAPDHTAHAVVLHEAGGEAMAFGPAWLAQTAEPGAPGVAVIAAHRDTDFAFLRDIVPGDAVEVLRPDGAALRFTVTHTEVVRHDRSGIVPDDGGPPRLALVTCWPFGVRDPGPLRFVAWAELAVEHGGR